MNLTSTGNKIVDEVGKLNFTGNIITEVWYKTIIKPDWSNKFGCSKGEATITIDDLAELGIITKKFEIVHIIEYI